jgi:hypothetical protein
MLLSCFGQFFLFNPPVESANISGLGVLPSGLPNSSRDGASPSKADCFVWHTAVKADFFPLTYSGAPYIARAQTRTNQNLLQICRAPKDVRPALLWNVSFDHSFVLVITSATKSLSSFFIFLLCPSQLCIYSGSHSFDDLPIYCTYIRKLCLLFLTDKSKSEVD